MKKKQWLLALFMALSFVFASCSGLIDGIMGSNSDEEETSSTGSKTLTISVSNYADVIDTSSDTARLAKSVARTISADSYKNTEADLAFWLYGSSTDGETLSPKSVNFTKKVAGDDTTSETSGTVTLDISASNWYLTLVAVTEELSSPSESDVISKGVLIGRANVDLRTGTSATFKLGYDGLSTAADVNLELIDESEWFATMGTELKSGATAGSTDEADLLWSINVGIYDSVTGAVVNSSEKALKNADFISAATAGTGETQTYNYTVSGIAAGTYLFKITFSNADDSSKVFYWSHDIRIIPGKKIEKVQEIPNVIGTKPNAPSKFYAQYTETFAEVPYGDAFIADFNWGRPSSDLKNESYFELEIAELAEDTTTVTFDLSKLASMDDDLWADYATEGANTDPDDTNEFSKVTSYNAKSFFETSATSPYYDSGVKGGSPVAALKSSLLSGSEHAEFVLSQGKRYFARIRAVNNSGESAWKYVSLSETAVAGRQTSAGANLTYKNFTSSINLFKIVYDPNGYTFYENGNTASGTKDEVKKYFSQESSLGVAVIDISSGASDGSGTSYAPKDTNATVIDTSTGNLYKTWLDTETKTAYSETVYKGYENLYLKAIVGTDAEYEIIDPATYKIDSTWVTFTDSSSTTVGNVTVSANGESYKASAKQGKLNVTLKLPAATTTVSWVYDYVEFKIVRTDGTSYLYEKKTGIKRDTDISVEQYLGTGIYQVTITARYGSIINSYVCDLTVNSK